MARQLQQRPDVVFGVSLEEMHEVIRLTSELVAFGEKEREREREREKERET